MKRMTVCFLTLIGMFFLCGNVQADLSAGLVASYSFDGNANDESGNGNDGAVYGAQLVADHNGIQNSAYSFDGVNDYIYFGNVLPDMNTMTIALWVYSSENESTIICDGDWAVGNDISFHINIDDSVYIRADKQPYSLSHSLDPGVYMNNTWRYVAWVMTGSDSQVYVDGILRNSINKGGTNVGYHNFIIGTEEYPQNSISWNGFWKGKISDLKIYNRALSDSEIQLLYDDVLITADDSDGGGGGCFINSILH